jgi:hypothetical protein
MQALAAEFSGYAGKLRCIFKQIRREAFNHRADIISVKSIMFIKAFALPALRE